MDARRLKRRLRGTSVSTVALLVASVLTAAGAGWVLANPPEPPPPHGSTLVPEHQVAEHSLLVVGDSWTTGGTMNQGPEWHGLMDLPPGWSVLTDAAGGSGYIGDHADSALTAGGRLRRLLADYEPDVAIVAMGRNDVQHDPAAVERVARADLSAMKQAWPRTEIVVFSPFSPEPPTEDTETLTATLARLAESLGVEFVDVSRIIGSRPGLIEDDHPNDAGHHLLAARIGQRLSALGVFG